jgi:hypothetical protein
MVASNRPVCRWWSTWRARTDWGFDVRVRAGACARTPERRDSVSFGASGQDQEGAHDLNDEKSRARWSTQRVITLVILLLILTLVIYLKVTGAV